MPAKSLLLALATVLFGTIASAESQLSFYGGYQTSPHSVVTGTDPANPVSTDLDFTAGWLGKSFTPPPYYGLRWTNWQNGTFGYGAEFTHSKVYADPQTLTDNGFSRLEFTDGLNIVTLNIATRFDPIFGTYQPYVMGGVGFALPHVDIQSGGDHTFGYQLSGPAARWTVGVERAINPNWSTFLEYQGTYSRNSVELVTGGSLRTNILTNALNFGVSRSF
jgi:lipid A oxidase